MPRRNFAPALHFRKILAEYTGTRRPDVSLWDIAKEVGCETGLMARVAQGKHPSPVKALMAVPKGASVAYTATLATPAPFISCRNLSLA